MYKATVFQMDHYADGYTGLTTTFNSDSYDGLLYLISKQILSKVLSIYNFIKVRHYDGTNVFRFEDRIIHYLTKYGYNKEYIRHMDLTYDNKTSELRIPLFESNRLISLLIDYLEQNINDNELKYMGVIYEMKVKIE